MSLPVRLYYPISKAAHLLECEFDDLIHHAAQERLELCIKVSNHHLQNDENGNPISWSVNSTIQAEQLLENHDLYQEGQQLAKKLFASYWHDNPDRQAFLICGMHHSKYFHFAELYDIEKRQSIEHKFSGLFSIDHDFIQLNEIKIINQDIADIVVYTLRLPRCEMESTEFYQLNHIEFTQPLSVSTKELLVSKDEAELLKKGGKKIYSTSPRINSGSFYNL